MSQGRRPLLIARKTFVDLARPTDYYTALFFDVALIIGGAAFISVFARLVITNNLFGKSVDLQNFGVMFIAFLLGRRRASLSVAFYILQGLWGWTVFPGGGGGGVEALATYETSSVIGYFFVSYVVGALAEHKFDRWPLGVAFAMIIGYSFLYLILGIWLYLTEPTWADMNYKFNTKYYLVRDILTTAVLMVLMPSLWWLANRLGWKK